MGFSHVMYFLSPVSFQYIQSFLIPLVCTIAEIYIITSIYVAELFHMIYKVTYILSKLSNCIPIDLKHLL